MKKKILSLFFLSFIGLSQLLAQDFLPKSSAQLFHELQKLNFLGNVLYVAAHPDDENTRLISYLNHELHAQTSYLSLTRGDGGQNLIGTEIRELLGVLRTQELLAARQIDGGSQYFTRANDFGFSKNPEETLAIWDREKVLSDMVARIRKLRPDVIINRFDHRTPGSTHGHHTSSAILSTQAFKLAGQPNNSPAKDLSQQAWQASRQFFNTSWWFYGSETAFDQATKNGLISLDVGVYYPQLGVSNNEIASQASSQHLCQGFGRLNQRGSEMEYLELIQGSAATQNNIFSGIDTSWNRIPEGAAIGAILEPLSEDFNFKNPAAHIDDLMAAYGLIQKIEDPFWRDQKTKQIKTLIKGVAGIHLSYETTVAFATPGDNFTTSMGVLVRNSEDFRIENLTLEGPHTPIEDSKATHLLPNKTHLKNFQISLADNAVPSNPYWLNKTPGLGMYQVSDPSLIGAPNSAAALFASVKLSFKGGFIDFEVPLVHRYAKADKGELWEPFTVAPRLSVEMEQDVVLFSDSAPKEILVRVTAMTKNVTGKVSIDLPKDWKMSPASHSFNLLEKGSSQVFGFELSAPSSEQELSVQAIATSKNVSHDQELVTIAYDHIPTQRVLRPATAKWVRLNIQKQQDKVGYLMGAGDKIPESLSAIGYEVTLLDPNSLGSQDLSPFKAVILGIRALNVHPELSLQKEKLLSYVNRGGVLISQYNTASRNGDNQVSIAPYPIQLSRDRVTKEAAPVTFLDPKHPVLQYPNPIDKKDFEGWVQERGLYFPNAWDPAYTPILEMNDPGESPKQGSLLVASYGKGSFVYTGLSFFRELPAGVPGAYKLFSNLISIPASIDRDPIKD